MQLKTVSSIGLAFLLVFGVVGVASAQDNVAATQGIWIRVDAPKANNWVAIGDTIKVRVLCYDGRLDDGFQFVVVDSSVKDNAYAESANASKLLFNFNQSDGRVAKSADETNKSGIDTFKVQISVAANTDANTDFQSVSKHSLKIVVDPTGTPDPDPLSNLMTNKKITPANTGLGATRVGDGVLFGVDAERPLHDAVFDSILLDTSRLTTVTTDTAETSDGQPPHLVKAIHITAGKEVKARLYLGTDEILTARPDRIEVALVPADSIARYRRAVAEGGLNLQLEPAREKAFKEDARLRRTVRGDALYSSNTSVSMDIEAGDFKNNERLEFFAYLVDGAGNLGGTASAANAANWRLLHGTAGKFVANIDAGSGSLAGAEVGVETNIPIIGDATAPKITMKYPHPDSITAGSHKPVITALIAKRLAGYKLMPGEVEAHKDSFKLNPLNFQVSEALDSIRILHGKNSKGFGGFIDDKGTDTTDDDVSVDATGGDSLATLSLDSLTYAKAADSTLYEKAGGVQLDLTIEVWDSLSNKSSMTLKGITLDGVVPTIKSLFPTAADAPKDESNEDKPTITLASKDPVFTIDEKLDSLSVRYIEAGGGAKAIVSAFGPGNARLSNVGELMSWPVNDTTFMEKQSYNLQILAIDLAGNAVAHDGGALTFRKGFMNPDPDQFKIVDDPDQKDKTVAGVDFTMKISVLDTTLTRTEGKDVRAVTYKQAVALGVIVNADQADALATVTFGGTGVSPAPTFDLPADFAAAGMVAKGAILNADDWAAGERSVNFKSEKPLANATVMVAEGSIDPATGEYSIRTSSTLSPVNVEVAEFSKLMVTYSEGEVSGRDVAGAFTINVTPVDAFDNPSMKIDNTVGSKTYDKILVTFSTSNAAVKLPSGTQTVEADGTPFVAVADKDLEGTALIAVTSVKTDFITGKDEDQTISGSVNVKFVREGGPGPDPGAPKKVAKVVVEDWKGADGNGDQGGVVVISFENSSDHDAVSHYQIFRQMDVTTGLDDEGNLIELDEPVKDWVSWTSVSFSADAGQSMGDAEGDMQRVVTPAIDNVATNWGVTAVSGAGSSDTTMASKRVFTKESIQQTLHLLGMPEAGLLTDEELSDQFNAPEDYVKSLIGDRKNVIFAPVNPDLSVLMGSASVPGNIRTDGHPTAGKFLSSARTITESPVAAVDNIGPAAVTSVTGEGSGGVVLRWTASADDRTVGSIAYRGYNIPILGVKGYKIMRGASADDLEMVATLGPGSTQFSDDSLPDGVTTLVYRIDAIDDNNVAMSAPITVSDISVRVKFVDAGGDPVYLIVVPAQGGNLEVDFEDFVAFAKAFNSQKGNDNYNPQADVDDDGTVDFSDFIAVAGSFGRKAAVGSKVAVVPQRPGVNADTEMRLDLTSEKVLVGETISVTVSMANAKALNGFGLELQYDADKFEFVSAVPAENDLLKSQGGETPLFKNWPEEGRISVVNAIIESGSVSGEGALVTFTFKVLSEFEDNARFEIARGVVFDANQLQNPVVTLGALDVQSTPTEFALHQNFPNPFNPQTNIPYDLAEGGDVVLRIYNLLGQEVRTLVRERQAPGRYTVQWSGMDDRGVSVSSGIYFYQVSVAGKFQDAKRLMLLK